MDKHGQLTSKVADAITGEMNKRGFAVYYDHGDRSNPNVGKIVSSISLAPVMGEELSQLDIAIVEKKTQNVVALIEIEETTDNPKTLLGDIFGILTGNSISFKKISGDWKIGRWTTLLIVGKFEKIEHKYRNEQICEMATRVKPALGTENSNIGNIVIKSFSAYDELEKILIGQVEEAI